jgi:hypothetical protein
MSVRTRSTRRHIPEDGILPRNLLRNCRSNTRGHTDRRSGALLLLSYKETLFPYVSETFVIPSHLTGPESESFQIGSKPQI